MSRRPRSLAAEVRGVRQAPTATEFDRCRVCQAYLEHDVDRIGRLITWCPTPSCRQRAAVERAHEDAAREEAARQLEAERRAAATASAGARTYPCTRAGCVEVIPYAGRGRPPKYCSKHPAPATAVRRRRAARG